MIYRIIAGMLLCLSLLSTQVQASEAQAWRVNRATAMQQVKRVGLITPFSGIDGSHLEALPTLDRAVREQLEIAGFTVVGSDVHAGIRARLLEQMGGIYDPLTGALDTQKQRTLEAEALRAYRTEQQLDATLTMEVRVRQARFVRDSAQWDGVTDWATGPQQGRRPPAPFEQGTLSALSLVLSLENANGDVLFSDVGGIELMSYVECRDFGGRRDVPEASLLRDEPRMRRAAEVATLWLRRSQAQLDAEARALADARYEAVTALRDHRKLPPFPPAPKPVPLPEQPVALAPQSIQPFKKSRAEILASVKRVVIAPITIDVAQDNVAARLRYEQLLTGQLQKLGWEIVASDRYAELLADEIKTGNSKIFDASTGRPLGDALHELRQRVLVELAADAIVYADVLPVSAPHFDEDAQWDGVQQNAADLGPWRSWSRVALHGIGRIPALSLGVVIADRNNESLYANRGGIQLLERAVDRKLEPIPKEELLVSLERDVTAVCVALRPLLLTPEELNPRKARQ